MNAADDAGRGRRSKVARLIEEYDLGEIGTDLERAWTAEGGERASLRELADRFNRALLRRAASDAGVQSLDGEIANTYRLLTDREASEAERMRARRRLERQDVDIEELRDDFVSYQAIRTYLKSYRGAEYESPDGDRIESATRTIQQLRSRLTAVTESRLEWLREGDEIGLENFSVIADLRVVCEDCGRQYPVEELLELGGCNCDAGE